MIKSHQSSLLRHLFFPKRKSNKVSPFIILETTKISKNKKIYKKKSDKVR